MIPYIFPPTLTVDSVHRPARQASPIVVILSVVANYSDHELANRALSATDETRDRLTQISIVRTPDDDRATVHLHRR